MAEEQYVPGTCNIGKKGVQKRRNAAIFGLVIFVLTVLLFQSTHAPAYYRVAVFFPLFISVLGFVQTRNKFCVAFGVMGVFSFSDKSETTTIEQQAYLKQDRKRATIMILQSIGISLAITVAFCLLPA